MINPIVLAIDNAKNPFLHFNENSSFGVGGPSGCRIFNNFKAANMYVSDVVMKTMKIFSCIAEI